MLDSERSRRRMRWLVAAAVLAGVAAFFLLDLDRFLSLGYLRAQQDALRGLYEREPFLTAGVFFAIYVLVTGLSLPGAAVMTLVAGALFGLLWGTVLVSFASTLGATLAFVIARFLLRAWVERRFRESLARVDRGIDREGAFYLFALRLVPIFPFFVINLVMGLTAMRVPVFALVSQVGMLPGTVVYINAGTQLAQVERMGDVLSSGLLLSFALLALFPLIARWVVAILRRRARLRGHRAPERFDRDLVVVGAGSGGLVSALIAAAVRAKVTLVERDRMGGDCLHTGCVPSKALIRSTRFLAQVGRSAELGVTHARAEPDFGRIMARVREVIATIEPHDSVERYESLGVECIAGEARVVSPYAVEIGGRTLTTRGIVIAAGASPLVPPIPGLEDVPYVTSETVWGLETLPTRLVVLGGGPIGCELSQCFARLGVAVTQVEMLPRLLPNEDPEISARVRAAFESEGIRVLAGHRAREFTADGVLYCERVGSEGGEAPERVEFELALLALGRRGNGAGLGLEALGIKVRENGTLETDDYLQTHIPTIFGCGDVVGPLQFTHVASHQAWYATINALFGTFKRFRADYSVIPHATFTEPEVARVGLNEKEAGEQGIDYEVTRFPFSELDRAIADARPEGEVKVLTVPGKDRILGATIVGEAAGDLIAEYALAMRHRLGLNKILGTVHAYPTLMEANKLAAGRWRREHAPERLLAWVERYHRWRRGGA